jgi:Protein of unknown function (DUF2726)
MPRASVRATAGCWTMSEAHIYDAALFAFVAWIFLIGFIAAGTGRRVSFRRGNSYSRSTQKSKIYAVPDLKDPEQQLRAVRAASFHKRPLLNYSEYRVFKVVEEEIAAAGRGYRVFAQTSLGEILQSRDDDAFHSINSKRVDFLVVDRGGWPVLAAEYQGSGHYQNKAAVRDAVKREALRKAGVRYVQIFPRETEEQIRARLREELGLRSATPSQSGKRKPALAALP